MKTLMVVTLLAVMTAGCSRKQSQPQLPEDERVKQQEAIRRFEQWTVQPGSGEKLTP